MASWRFSSPGRLQLNCKPWGLTAAVAALRAISLLAACDFKSGNRATLLHTHTHSHTEIEPGVRARHEQWDGDDGSCRCCRCSPSLTRPARIGFDRLQRKHSGKGEGKGKKGERGSREDQKEEMPRASPSSCNYHCNVDCVLLRVPRTHTLASSLD